MQCPIFYWIYYIEYHGAILMSNTMFRPERSSAQEGGGNWGLKRSTPLVSLTLSLSPSPSQLRRLQHVFCGWLCCKRALHSRPFPHSPVRSLGYDCICKAAFSLLFPLSFLLLLHSISARRLFPFCRIRQRKGRQTDWRTGSSYNR